MAARRTAAGPIPVTVTELVRSGLLSRHRMMAWRFARGHGVSVSDAIEAVSLKADAKKPVSRPSADRISVCLGKAIFASLMPIRLRISVELWSGCATS